MNAWLRIPILAAAFLFFSTDPAFTQTGLKPPPIAPEEHPAPATFVPSFFPEAVGIVINVPADQPTIQAAIAAATPGDTIQIAGGVYVENVVVNQSVWIRGAGAGSTIVRPSFVGANTGGGSIAPGHSSVFLVQSHNVTIEKLTVDGDNPGLTSGIVFGGADIDARNGIIADHTLGTIANLTVQYVEVKNIFLRGIQQGSSLGTFAFRDNRVSNVQANPGSIGIFNFGGSGTIERDTVTDCNDGIAANHSRGTQFLDNVVSNSGSGIHSDNGGSGGGVADLIQGNTVSNSPMYGYGVWIFSQYIAPTVQNNTVTNVDIGLAVFANAASPNPTVVSVFANNTVDGQSKPNSAGFYISNTTFWYHLASVSINMTGNEITNNTEGVFIESAAGYSITIANTGNAIHGNTDGITTGAVPVIYGGSGSPGTVSATMTGSWWGSATGPYNATTNASATGNSIADGIDYSPWWGADYRSVAHPWNWHANASNGSTLQEAITAATAGDTVNAAATTFNERVTINKSLTLRGATETTTILDGTGLPGTGKGIAINNGIVNVTIKDLTVQNYAGLNGNTDAGIYAIGGNNNLTVEQVTIQNNVGGSGFYANGPVDNVLINYVTSSGHTVSARGIVIWNGLKSNITITNCTVFNNNCCGIELQDGTASGVTVENNIVYNNGDNGIGIVGMQGPGENLVKGNVLTDNGRFGIEIKNPNGSGLATGAGRVVVENNDVSRTVPIGAEVRDLVGIAAFRRGVLAGNVDIPVGVVIQNNTVSGYVQPSTSDGFGIVAEGINHTITGNTVTGCDVGIQRQSGHTPYPGDGNQNNIIDQYFGRGNSPVSCGITVSGNTLSNTVDTRDVPGAIALQTGYVKNTTTDSLFCTIQSAINDPATSGGHTLEVNAGNYDEQVLVNKGVTLKGIGASLPVVDFTGSPTGKPTLFDISVDGVTVDSIRFNVDLSKLKSAIIASAVGLDNITITNNVVDAYGTPLAGLYSDRNAVSINYGGNTNYRVASGGVDNIVFQGNTVNGSLPSSFFRAGVAVDEGGGTFSGNTSQTINHDVIVRFGNNGNVTVSGNFLNGGGVEFSDMNAGAGILAVSNNNFDGTAANLAAPGTAVLRLKNNYNSKTTLVTGNVFTNHEWAVSMENYNTVTLDNNTFTPLASSTSYHHVVVNTKSISTNSSSIVQVPIGAVLTNNTFNWSGAFGGAAVSFLNHDSDAASFGTFTIGSAGNTNTFNNGIQYTLFLDGETGSSLGTVFPNYNGLIGIGAGAITTKAPWATSLNGVDNLYDVGSGAMSPASMSLTDLYTLEDRIVHKVDAGALGTVTVVPNHRYVTSNSYYTPLTTAAHIQRGIDAANGGDTANVAPGTYRGQIYINKNTALLGSGRAVTEIVPPIAVMNQPFLPARLERPIIGVDSLGTNVIVDGFTIDGEGAGNTHANMVGVQYFKASGIVRNNTVKRIRPTPFDGSQTNVGILVNHAFPAVYNHTVEIHDDSVYDFGKTGIVCNHPGVTGNVHNNVVIGQGPVGAGFAAQNGIQFGFGATGTIANNEVRDFSYTGGSFAASSVLGVATGGILTINGNTIVEGQVGINLQQSAAYPSGSSSAEVYGNTFTASTAGTGLPVYYGAITWSEGGASPASGPSTRPLPVAPFDDIPRQDIADARGPRTDALATMTVDLADNTFTSTSSGSGYGLYMLALATSPQTVTGDSNTFTGLEVAVVADKDAGAVLNSTWRRNSFAGNTYGMYDLTGVLQDARENWWNDATGPADPKSLPATPNYNNPGGMGDSVTAFIDYNPWYTDAAKTSLSYYTISVNTVGDGSVTKSPDTTAYAYFQDVLLTALPDPGWHFVGWSGDTTSVDNPITITVIGDMNYTATFAINQYPINLIITGDGTVDKAPDQLLYDHGTPVTLTANPDLGWNFVAWMGDTVTASNPITVTMNDTLNIEAVFAINVYTLNVGVVGSGVVAKNPDLPGYAHGMNVGLKATPSIGHHFVGWTGDTTETADSLYITIEGDVNLTATFAINTYTLNIAIVGSGSVGKVPDQPTYNYGSSVTLTAVPYVSSSFIGWSGDTVTVDNPITLTMTDDVNLTAAFTGDKFLTVTTDTLLIKGLNGRWQRPAKRGRDLEPNWANLLSEVVIQGGFQPNATESDSAGGMRVGLSFLRAAGAGKYRPLRDSAVIYGWARLSTWKRNSQGAGWNNILRTLEDRTGTHSGSPRGFDVLFRGNGNQERVLVGERRNLPPKRYNNALFAELIALKFNIAASQLLKTPAGLGELIFVQPGNLLNGEMVRDISRISDSLMTHWRGRGQEEYDSLYSAIYRINRAFLAPIDTVAWVAGGQLVLNGAVGLDSVSFLEGAYVPPIILERTTDETEGDEDDFDDEEFLDGNGAPLAVRLDQNYPNPFNPSTTVQFRLRETALVTLKVYDMLGREVATILNDEVMDEGPQYADFTASGLASGVYFCRVEAVGIEDDPVRTVQTLKMMLVK